MGSVVYAMVYNIWGVAGQIVEYSEDEIRIDQRIDDHYSDGVEKIMITEDQLDKAINNHMYIDKTEEGL